MSVRARLLGALRGEHITAPRVRVYDAFLPNPAVDWDFFFHSGLDR
jgi:hypothetical protein